MIKSLKVSKWYLGKKQTNKQKLGKKKDNLLKESPFARIFKGTGLFKNLERCKDSSMDDIVQDAGKYILEISTKDFEH